MENSTTGKRRARGLFPSPPPLPRPQGPKLDHAKLLVNVSTTLRRGINTCALVSPLFASPSVAAPSPGCSPLSHTLVHDPPARTRPSLPFCDSYPRPGPPSNPYCRACYGTFRPAFPRGAARRASLIVHAVARPGIIGRAASRGDRWSIRTIEISRSTLELAILARRGGNDDLGDAPRMRVIDRLPRLPWLILHCLWLAVLYADSTLAVEALKLENRSGECNNLPLLASLFPILPTVSSAAPVPLASHRFASDATCLLDGNEPRGRG